MDSDFTCPFFTTCLLIFFLQLNEGKNIQLKIDFFSIILSLPVWGCIVFGYFLYKSANGEIITMHRLQLANLICNFHRQNQSIYQTYKQWKSIF